MNAKLIIVLVLALIFAAVEARRINPQLYQKWLRAQVESDKIDWRNAAKKAWEWAKKPETQDKVRRTIDVWRSDEDEEEADFINWKKIGGIAKDIGKNYLSTKYGINLDQEEEESDAEFLGKALKKVGKVALSVGKMYARTQGIPIDAEEEADFINLKKVWGVAKNIGKSYLSSKYGINLDEEEETDAEFLSKLKNWWNSKGKDLAIKGLQIYSQIKNGGAQQGDDEVEADLKLGNFFKKALNVAKNVGKSYLSSKYGINLDEEEEADFINWKKIGGIAKDIGKNYLSTKYGINLDEEEEESDFINWKKIGGIAKDIGKNYLSTKYGINLDEEDDE